MPSLIMNDYADNAGYVRRLEAPVMRQAGLEEKRGRGGGGRRRSKGAKIVFLRR